MRNKDYFGQEEAFETRILYLDCVESYRWKRRILCVAFMDFGKTFNRMRRIWKVSVLYCLWAKSFIAIISFSDGGRVCLVLCVIGWGSMWDKDVAVWLLGTVQSRWKLQHMLCVDATDMLVESNVDRKGGCFVLYCRMILTTYVSKSNVFFFVFQRSWRYYWNSFDDVQLRRLRIDETFRSVDRRRRFKYSDGTVIRT